jgi:hypothetical protein
MSDGPAGPPPGWYLDPGGQQVLRWWNGRQWGPHTQPLPEIRQEPQYPQQTGPHDPAADAPGWTPGPPQRTYHPPEPSGPYQPQGSPDRQPWWPQPGTQGPQPQPHPGRPRKRRSTRRQIFTIACVLVIAVAVISVVASLASSGGAKYSAHVVSYTAVNPADLSVAIRVTNTGSETGTPTCTIDAEDPSYTYTGVDVATLQGTVAPGASAAFVDNLTITKQGASYVTQVTVSC